MKNESAPMNAEQSRYMTQRLNSVIAAKEEKLRAKYTKPAIEITDRERYLLLKSGKVKLRAKQRRSVDFNDDVGDVFDFSPFEKDEKFNKKSFERDLKIFREKAQAVRDQLVLGTIKDPLKVLTALAK